MTEEATTVETVEEVPSSGRFEIVFSASGFVTVQDEEEK